jgi:large subunit ribosomal protein L23
MKVNKKNLKNTDLLCLDMFRDSVLTEKSVENEMKYNTMTFVVYNKITKTHIKAGIEKFFGINVLSVRTLNTKGKLKNFKGKKFSTLGFKKAIVRVDNLDKVREVLNG